MTSKNEDILRELGLDVPSKQPEKSASKPPQLAIPQLPKLQQRSLNERLIRTDNLLVKEPESIVFVESGKNRGPVTMGILLAGIFSLLSIFLTAFAVLNSTRARTSPTYQVRSSSTDENQLERQGLEPRSDHQLSELTLAIVRDNAARIADALTAWKVKFSTADFDIRSAQSDAILSNSSTGHLRALAARDRLRFSYATFASKTTASLIELGDTSVSTLRKAGYSEERALQEISTIVKPLLLEMHKLLQENPAPKP